MRISKFRFFTEHDEHDYKAILNKCSDNAKSK